MIPFLEKVAEELISLRPESLLVVFPTRRACQEFRKIYSEKKRGVSRLPVIIPISELPDQLDTTVIADDVTLILYLKEIYEKLFGDESFEAFLPFGRQMLDDFNEIDRQNIDAIQLFQQIKDLKQLDERFAPDSEENELIKNFWREFINPPYTPLQSSFLAYWRQLPELYLALKKKLAENNLAFEGMIWNQLAHSVNQQSFFKRFDYIAFPGFYALNKTEEMLLDKLSNEGKLKLFIDSDDLYVRNTFHEAGLFLRKGYLSKVDKWTEKNFDIPKESYIVRGCNGRFSIARELAIQLHNELSEEANTGIKRSRIIVLADESLLYPFLHHCFNLQIPVNASMGFPLKHHPIFKLLQQIKSLKKYTQEELTDNVRIRFLEDFYNDPVIATNYKNHSVLEDINHAKPRYHPEVEELLFAADRSIANEIDRLNSLLEGINYDENWMQELHIHTVHVIRTGVSLLKFHETQLTPAAWWHLLLEYLSEQRVPFYSDTDSGIPVVGFLESRVMDFEVVHIAPLNEGSLPSKVASKSLIPYSIRKAYHLPCKEEQDAVTAYHFYRLLQRASYIRLYYNTNIDATGGGEKSRYLHQLQQELIKRTPPEKTEFSIQESIVSSHQIQPICIEKNHAVLAQLKKRFSPETTDTRKKGFSASALSSYISCPLRFYFDQVAGIRPEDDTASLTGGNFGNVLHRCMELLYEKKKVILPEDIRQSINSIEDILNKAVREVYDHPVDSGHDYLMKEVLKALVLRILRYDYEQAPFEIIGLEDELHISLQLKNDQSVGLKGIIDRLDMHDEKLRILDYKTGQDAIGVFESIDELFTDPANKLNFQLMLYCYLVSEYYPDLDYPIYTGIFRMRQFDEGIDWLNNGNEIIPEDIESFKYYLLNLLDEIMNPEIPFKQTEDIDRCRFCNYRNLCQRTDI